MAGKQSPLTRDAVEFYRHHLRVLRAADFRITRAIRRAVMAEAARHAGVHRTTLWRALRRRA